MKKHFSLFAFCLAQACITHLQADDVELNALLEVKQEIYNTSQEILKLKERISKENSLRDEEKKQLMQVSAFQEKEIATLYNSLNERYKTDGILISYTDETVSVSDEITDCCPSGIGDWRLCLSQPTFWVTGELLYWRTLGNDLTYAFNPLSSLTTVSDFKQATYDWDLGLRVAIGYRFEPHFWEVEADYTYFHNKGKDHTSLATGIYPAFPINQELGTNTAGSTTLSLHYNLVNLSLASSYLLCDNITLRPMLAASGAFLHQNWTADFQATLGTTNFDIDWTYYAGGIRFACDFDWFLGKGFSLFSHLGFGGYVGPYSFKEKAIETFSGSEILRQNTKEKDTVFAMNARFVLGPTWGMLVNNWAFTLFVLYEFNPWFNLQTSCATESDTEYGFRRIEPNTSVLTPQGLTAGVKIAF